MGEDIHPLERVFKEFAEVVVTVNATTPRVNAPEAPWPLKRWRQSLLKDGDGETIFFYETRDGLAVLGVTPRGVEPQQPHAELTYQVFQVPKGTPWEKFPAGTDPGEINGVIRRMRKRVHELCVYPN